MEWWLAYLVLGLVVGFFAGLLGIGGGAIIVPLLVTLFGVEGLPADRIVHLALGTSLASIVFTSMSTVRAHHRHGAVRWDILRATLPWMVAGTLAGALFAEHLPSRYLAIFFTVFICYSAVHLWIDVKPKPTRQLPGKVGMAGAGFGLGALSSLVGAGGGVISVPLMSMYNIPMRNVIGTSAALTIPIAVAGSIGYIFTGFGKDHLPALSLGYVYLPALVGIVVGTFVTVPFGVRAAHRLPVRTLKRIFAIVLFLLAIKAFVGLF